MEPSSHSLVDFGSPPLVEVAYGVKFAPLADFKLPHIGIYWKRVRDEFPRCEHAAPILGSEIVDAGTGLLHPRVWLINGDDDRLIQLQPGRFHFNWRRRDGAGPYPRYHELSQKFLCLYSDFSAFVKSEKLGAVQIQGLELTYINHIFREDGGEMHRELGSVVEFLNWSESGCEFLRTPDKMHWQAQFPMPDSSGGLTVKISSGTRATDQKELFVMELTAVGQPLTSADEMAGWLELAHEWIVKGFVDLTSESAQRVRWKKR